MSCLKALISANHAALHQEKKKKKRFDCNHREFPMSLQVLREIYWKQRGIQTQHHNHDRFQEEEEKTEEGRVVRLEPRLCKVGVES